MVRNILQDLGYTGGIGTVYSDNAVAITTVVSKQTTDIARHIDIKFHVARDRIRQGIFEISYLDTKLNIADVLTKAFSSPALFLRLRRGLMCGFSSALAITSKH